MRNRFAVALLLTASPITLAAQDKPVEVAFVANSIDGTVEVIDVATRGCGDWRAGRLLIAPIEA
jgi:hypothetical protein